MGPHIRLLVDMRCTDRCKGENSALQEEGGANWSYSQGEIEDLLQSKQPLPPQLQQVMEARSAFAELAHPFVSILYLPKQHSFCSCHDATYAEATICHCADSLCTVQKRHSCQQLGKDWSLRSYCPSCRSIGLQLFESIDKGQEAEAIRLIDKESRSAYIRDANKHGYTIHHAVFQVPTSPCRRSTRVKCCSMAHVHSCTAQQALQSFQVSLYPLFMRWEHSVSSSVNHLPAIPSLTSLHISPCDTSSIGIQDLQHVVARLAIMPGVLHQRDSHRQSAYQLARKLKRQDVLEIISWALS